MLGTVRESANRLANCDAANARRAASAGARQAALLSELMESPEWNELPAQLRDVAELRVEYPYLSLTELAELTDPPLEPVGPQPPPAPARRPGGRAGDQRRSGAGEGRSGTAMSRVTYCARR